MVDSDIKTDGILYSVLIIGCNRGLGLELVRFLIGLKKPPQYLFATCRDLDTCSALKAYNVFWNSRKTKVKILQLEVNNDDDIANVVSAVEQDLDGVGLSVLINNAETHTRKDLDTVSWVDMKKTFETNTISPIMIARAFRSIVSSFVLLGSNKVVSKSYAAIVNISSVLGRSLI
jgi:NAD(P)-dependent dehydrogenase (short-subunit alcohol dehydrogenase family)